MTYFPHPSPKALDFFNMLGSLPTWSPHSFRPVAASPPPPPAPAPPSSLGKVSLQSPHQLALLMQDLDRSSKLRVLFTFVPRLAEVPSSSDQPFVTLNQ